MVAGREKYPARLATLTSVGASRGGHTKSTRLAPQSIVNALSGAQL
jgi:hypothetical protein